MTSITAKKVLLKDENGNAIIPYTDSQHFVGQKITINATQDYIPEGCLPCIGEEYNKGQFNDFWNNYLKVAKPLENGWNYKYKNIVNMTQEEAVDNGIMQNSSFYFSSSNWQITFEIDPTTFSQQIFLETQISDTIYFSAGLEYDENDPCIKLSADSNSLFISITNNMEISIKRENNTIYYRTAYNRSWTKFSYLKTELTEEYTYVNVFYMGNIILSRSLINGVYLATTIPEYYSLVENVSYEQYQNEVNTYGFCGKFGIKSQYNIVATCSREGFEVTVNEDSIPEDVDLTMRVIGEGDSMTAVTTNDKNGKNHNIAYYGLRLSGDLTTLKDGDIIKISKRVVEDGTFKAPTSKQIDRYLIKKKEPTEADMSWYNLYSDGWIEQGGTVVSGAVASYLVTFPIEMKDLSYTPLIAPFIGASDDTGADDNVYAILSGLATGSYPYAKSTTQLRVSTLSKANAGFNWSVEGYVNLQQISTPREFIVVANGNANKSMFDWAEWYSSLKDIKDTVDNFSGGGWEIVDLTLVDGVQTTGQGKTISFDIDLSDIFHPDHSYEYVIKTTATLVSGTPKPDNYITYTSGTLLELEGVWSLNPYITYNNTNILPKNKNRIATVKIIPQTTDTAVYSNSAILTIKKQTS